MALGDVTEMVFPQLAKARVRALGCGGQRVADLDLAVGHDHPVDEQLHQQPPLGERGRGQPVPDGPAETLDPVGASAAATWAGSVSSADRSAQTSSSSCAAGA